MSHDFRLTDQRAREAYGWLCSYLDRIHGTERRVGFGWTKCLMCDRNIKYEQLCEGHMFSFIKARRRYAIRDFKGWLYQRRERERERHWLRAARANFKEVKQWLRQRKT